MRNIIRIAKLGSLFGLLAVAPAAMAAGQTGGTYSLTLDGGAPIALASLDFGETSVVNGANGSIPLSPVTITTVAGAEAIPQLVSHCVTHVFYHSMTATYANAQGQAQFVVKFSESIVSSISLPAADKTSSPRGAITLVFGVQHETVEPPPPPSNAPGAAQNPTQAHFNRLPAMQKLWRAQILKPAGAPPGGKFSFTIAGADTSGVLTVSPFTLTTSGYGGSSGIVTIAPMVLTVDATKAASFVAFQAQNPVIPKAVLTYNLQDDSGRNDVMTITLTQLRVPSCVFTGTNGSAPFYTVQLTFKKLTIQGSNGPTIASWDLAMLRGS